MYHMDIVKFLTSYNHNVKRAIRLADNFLSFVDQYASVIASGAEVIDIREVPNAQPSYRLNEVGVAAYRERGERLPRRVSEKTQPAEYLEAARVPCVPTTATREQVLALVQSIESLNAQARLVDFLHKRGQYDPNVARRVLNNQRDAIAALAAIDPDAFEYAVRDFDKAHVSDFDTSAGFDVFGFHWTGSLKGDATETRYEADREIRSNNKTDMRYAQAFPASIDEDGLADALGE